MTRCPCHPLGIHYFVWFMRGIDICIDCGEHRKDALKGEGGSEIGCHPSRKGRAA